MTTRRSVLRGVAVALWALAAFPMASSWGEPETVVLDKYGWWNANQTLPADPTGGLLPPVDVPASPGAPDDGLYVEAGGGTERAISGVSYYTGGGVDATLTLDAVGDADPSAATLAACPAAPGWDAAQNGRWDARPSYDPATCTFLGTVRGSTVTFDIPASAHEAGSAYLSLAIVPAEGSGTFSIGFAPPTSSSLVTTEPEAPSAAPAPAPAPVSPAPSAGSASSSPTSTFDVPAPTAPAITGSGATDDVATGGGTAAPAPAAAVADEASTAARVTAAVVLAAIGAGLALLASRPQRAPRLLGSLAGGADAVPAAVEPASRPRGLGRFARPRTAPPTGI